MASYTRALKLTTYTTVTFHYDVTETATATTYKLTKATFANSRSTGLAQKMVWYIYADVQSPNKGTQVKELTEKSVTLAKGTKSKTVTIGTSANIAKVTSDTPAWVRLRSDLDTTDYATNYTKEAYYSHPAVALARYAVSYSANGGSGAPSAQTKWYGRKLALTTAKPTRTNHVFKGWNTKADGTGTAYASGASYAANAAVTLYAQWYAPYAVSYNANGGSGAPAAQTKVHNAALALSATRPTRANHRFLGWATSAGAASAQYQPGGSYTANAAVTLYAVWRKVYASPSLTVVRSYRCDANGAVDDEGAYAAVVLSWSLFDTGSNSVRSLSATVNGATATATPTGLSGTATLVVAAQMDANLSYAVTASVTDRGCATSGVAGSSATTTRADSISTAYFPMDFRAGGHGAGIGTAANEEGVCRVQHSLRVLDDSGGTVLLVRKDGTVQVSNPAAWRSALGIS